MSGFNQVILLGRLGNDPEVKYTQGGSAVCSLSIATSRRRKDDAGEWQEVTAWHRCKAFGKQAEVIGEHVKKGDLLFVEGRLDYWEAKSDRGGKLMIAEVIVEHFEFGGGARRSESPAPASGGSTARERARQAVHGGGEAAPPAAGAATGQQRPFDEPFDDDIPF